MINYSSLGSEKMVQLTVEQCVLVMTTYSLTGSYVAVRRPFQQKFPGHRPPTYMTIYRHVHKYIEHGTSLNRNLVASSRPRSGRPVENNDQAQEALEENPKDMVCQRNGLGLSKVTFNYILRIDFKCHQ